MYLKGTLRVLCQGVLDINKNSKITLKYFDSIFFSMAIKGLVEYCNLFKLICIK